MQSSDGPGGVVVFQMLPSTESGLLEDISGGMISGERDEDFSPDPSVSLHQGQTETFIGEFPWQRDS